MLAILAAAAGQAAVIYKWTDADGVIHYSDQPVPGAQKMTISAAPRSGTTLGARGTGANDDPPDQPREAPGLGYTQLAIASPQPDQSFFGDETITAGLALSPGLKANHVVTWRLNGQALDAAGATQFNLPHLDRGTYSIAATITDQQSGESQSTDSVNFFVRQPSALSPQHQKP